MSLGGHIIQVSLMWLMHELIQTGHLNRVLTLNGHIIEVFDMIRKA